MLHLKRKSIQFSSFHFFSWKWMKMNKKTRLKWITTQKDYIEIFWVHMYCKERASIFIIEVIWWMDINYLQMLLMYSIYYVRKTNCIELWIIAMRFHEWKRWVYHSVFAASFQMAKYLKNIFFNHGLASPFVIYLCRKVFSFRLLTLHWYAWNVKLVKAQKNQINRFVRI